MWPVESGEALTETTPVTLGWDNGAGLTFRQTISVDDDYMFTVTQSVENATGAEVRLAPYGIIARHGIPPDLKNFYILHEGVILVGRRRADRDRLRRRSPTCEVDPAEGARRRARRGGGERLDRLHRPLLDVDAGRRRPARPSPRSRSTPAARDTFQTDMRLPAMTVAPGATRRASRPALFAGAKEWATLRDYQKTRAIDRFVDAIDWGWFFFLTKPIFRALH